MARGFVFIRFPFGDRAKTPTRPTLKTNQTIQPNSSEVRVQDTKPESIPKSGAQLFSRGCDAPSKTKNPSGISER